ncbi:MAG: DUF2752 domain-containing protein [Lachnospiraceae bacterium]|nr:DUF2752 domain-containing protein [Lachnospiraceae bacterium]
MKNISFLIKKDLKVLMPVILMVLSGCAFLDHFFHRICLFSLVTGLPCPGCGLTRAFAALIKGNIQDALSLNAMIFLWILLVLYLGYCRYVIQKMQAFTPALIIVCLLTIAYYVYRMVYVYPEGPVMSYYENNLIALFLRYSSSGRIFR